MSLCYNSYSVAKASDNTASAGGGAPGKWKVVLISILSGLFVLAVYIHFLAPDIIGGDSADLVGQAHRLGVCHASGYPTTVIAGKLFTLLPVRNVPYRVNLMSAVCAAAAVALVVLLAHLFVRDIVLCGFSGILLGLSPVFWSQAEFAEVYTFAAFLTSLSFLFLFLFFLRQERAYFLLGMLLFGLSWTAHMNNLLHVPAVVALIFFRRNVLPFRTFLLGIGLFLIGLTPYVWMMFRAAVVPPFSYFNPPSTPARLVPYVFGMAHGPTRISSPGFLLEKVAYFGKLYLLGFLAVGAVPAILGLADTMRKHGRACIVMILIVFANNAFSANYHFYLDVYAFLIPSLIVFAIWVAAGLDVMKRQAVKRLSLPNGRYVPHAFAAAWIVAALGLHPSASFSALVRDVFRLNSPTVDLRDAWADREFLEEMKHELPPDCAVVTPWYQFTLFKYAQTAENFRPDVVVLLHRHTTQEDLVALASESPDFEMMLVTGRLFYVDARGIMEDASHTFH